jgi:hypothetical protein
MGNNAGGVPILPNPILKIFSCIKSMGYLPSGQNPSQKLVGINYA